MGYSRDHWVTTWLIGMKSVLATVSPHTLQIGFRDLRVWGLRVWGCTSSAQGGAPKLSHGVPSTL